MEFLEELIECFYSKIENGQWISLLFWSFITARFVTFIEQIIRKAMTNSLRQDLHTSVATLIVHRALIVRDRPMRFNHERHLWRVYLL